METEHISRKCKKRFNNLKMKDEIVVYPHCGSLDFENRYSLLMFYYEKTI